MGECSACSGQQVDSRVAVVVTNHNHNPNALVRCKYFALQLGGRSPGVYPRRQIPLLCISITTIYTIITVVIVVFE